MSQISYWKQSDYSLVNCLHSFTFLKVSMYFCRVSKVWSKEKWNKLSQHIINHELPNSTSNINDTHEAYFHFENKRNAVQEGTHVDLGKKKKFKIFSIRIRIPTRGIGREWKYGTDWGCELQWRARLNDEGDGQQAKEVENDRWSSGRNSVQWRQQYYLTDKASLCPCLVRLLLSGTLQWISWNSWKF